MSAIDIVQISEHPALKTRADLRDDKKYQRPMKESRFKEIKNFWDDPNNQLVDNIVLVIKDKTYPGCIDTNAPNWMILKPEGNIIADILDGQHRVMGCKKSKEFGDEPLPVSILLESEFQPRALGKIFTKLNSEAQPIDKLNAMHLKARYSLKPWIGPKNKNGYQSMLSFYDDPSSPLYGKIQLFNNEKDKRYTSLKIAETLRGMWNGTSWSREMPHKDGSNLYMIGQFNYFLEVLFKSGKGIWWQEFSDETSSLATNDGFCDLLINLYPDFYDITAKLSKGKKPVLSDWENAISKISDNGINLNEVIKWKSYKEYINQRRHKWVFLGMQKLLSHTISASGDLEFDFDKAIHGHNTLTEYLGEFVGDFSITFKENGFTVANPKTTDFTISFNRAELCDKSALLNIEKYDSAKKEWVNIYRNGLYGTDADHFVSKGNIKQNLSEQISLGNKYKFIIKQTTGGNSDKTVSETITL